MSSSNTRPKWFRLYLVLPLLVSLFILDFHLKLSTRGHEAVQFGILLFVYGLVHWWLKANSNALSKLDWDHYYTGTRIYHISPLQSSEEKDRDRPLLHLPDSGIKGMLSDVFEIEYIDREQK